MQPNDQPPRYHAYMLRMWEERPDQDGNRHDSTWRFHLENPHTGRRQGFADLAALLDYLRAVIMRESGSDED